MYETFLCVCPATAISFEHAWYLGQVLCHSDEYVLASCPDCRALWIRDTLEVFPDICAACRVPLQPDVDAGGLLDCGLHTEPAPLPVPNVFAGPYLDRAAHLRKDEDFVAAAARDPQSLLVPVWRSRSLVRREADGWSAGLVEATSRVAARPSMTTTS